MAKKYSAATQSLIDGASYALRKKWEREAAAQPDADLSVKLYGPLREPLLSDATRGCVSPLDGRAKPRAK
jgi:hypothetical protein